MPSYVVLGKYTEQGIKNFDDLPTRLAAVKEQMQGAGGRMIVYYLTMGSYDFVSVAEFPDNETGARFAIAINQQGNVPDRDAAGLHRGGGRAHRSLPHLSGPPQGRLKSGGR